MPKSVFAFLRAALSTSFTLVALSLCALWIRLSAAPVPIDSYAQIAQQTLAEKLERSAPGWGVRIGGLAIAWDEAERRPGARLSDVSLIDPSGGVAFQAPSVSIGVDFAAALFDGRVEPTGVTVHGAEVVFVRSADGEWRFNLSTVPAAPAGTPAEDQRDVSQSGAAMLDAAGEVLNSQQNREDAARLIDALTGDEPLFGVLGGLRSVNVKGAGVTYRDDLTGAYLRAEQSRLELSLLEGGGLRLTAQSLLEIEERPADEAAGPAAQKQAERRIARAQQALDPNAGRAVRAKISLVAERLRGAREASLSVRFVDAPLSSITAQFHDLDALQALEGYVSGRALARLSLDSGDLLAFSASLRGEGAEFAALRRRAEAARREGGGEAQDVADPLALSAFSAQFDYAPESDAVLLKELKITGDRLEATLVGDARFLRDAKGAAVGAKGALRISAAKVLDPQLFETPLVIEEGGFEYRLEGGAPGSAEPPKLWVEALSVRTADLQAEGAARVLFAPPLGKASRNQIGAALGLRADLDLDLSDFQLPHMPRFWPLPAASGAREWVAKYVDAGWIRQGRVKARIGGGAGFAPRLDGEKASQNNDGKAKAASSAKRETIDFVFRFDSLVSRYLDDMTPIQNASGVGRVEADRFEVRFEKAGADLGAHGALILDGSRFAVTSFEPEYPPGEITVRSDSPVRALLALIDQPPLALTRKLDLKPEDMKGRAKGTVRMSLPLKKDLPAEAVKIDAQGVIKRLEMPVRELGGAKASVKRAAIKVTGDSLRLRGETVLEGYEDFPFQTSWREVFSPKKGRPATVLTASRRLTAKRLTELGLPQDWALDGAATLALRVTKHSGEELKTDATIDLTGLAGRLPWIGWAKQRGAAGKVTADLRRSNGLLKLADLKFEAEGLSAAGSADFDASNRLRRIDLTSLKTASGSDLALDIALAEDGGISISGGGKRLQLAPVAEPSAPKQVAQGQGASQSKQGTAQKNPSISAGPRLSLNLLFERVTLGKGAGLQDAAIALARSEKGGFYADLTARVEGGVITGSARPEPNGVTRYKLNTDQLGLVLTALGLVEQAERGEARLEAVERADGKVIGRLEGKGLVIKSVPAVADALAVVGVVGILDLAATGGVTFTAIEAPFTLDENELVVDKFTAKGPSLGLTFNARYQHRYNVLDLKGNLSPAFMLNGLPGELPVIGRILTGGEGQGIFGFNFALKGPLEEPEVVVNPLSALTPGPLRGIFGG